MANSYRLRTKVGVDSYLSVQLDQDFEYLEILSLKILQEQIYTRPCADYGVIVGRLTVNGGYGIPNVKVSIFIPVSEQDKLNPLIYDLYPYEKITDQNADGYRYNLLPYKKSYSAHNPTGTFFDREDVLTSPTLIEVYDKYYKYCASTNSSGDYMIFGAPIGTYTIHVDIDLSDIGEFSLAPQDLIRMGIATPGQVAGVKFNASENLNELPQIISLNKAVDVQPLWGQPEICNLGVNRVDFDLTKETKIQITPTSIFMGSLITGNDEDYQKRNCKPKLNLGDQCSLIAGPGIIQSLRQTLFIDPNTGYPGLEFYDLEQGGQVIDDNGAWMIDVPMNLDYVITNEFGEQVISPDPNVGIPTKGKYRFKIKWAQGDTLSEPIKRGYFLVPNVREYWSTENEDPFNENNGAIQVINPEFLNYSETAALAEKSYSFSTDWNDYPDPEVAIKCEDYFYELTYNKVYTVSQMMDSYNSGVLLNRKIAIKHILNSECASENNKFPVNDGQYRFDIIFLLFSILLLVSYIVMNVIVLIFHIVGILVKILGQFLGFVLRVIVKILRLICDFINDIILENLRGIGFAAINIDIAVYKGCVAFCDDGWYPLKHLQNVTWCDDAADALTAWADFIENLYKKFQNVQVPMLTYPDCELCDCSVGESTPGNDVSSVENDPELGVQKIVAQQLNKNSFLAPITLGLIFNKTKNFIPNLPSKTLLMAPVISGGTATIGTTPTSMFYREQNTKVSAIISGIENDSNLLVNSKTRVPQSYQIGENVDYFYWSVRSQNPVINKRVAFSLSLPISERMNLFNLKSKYFNENLNNYHGLGVNRIKVTFGSDLNGGPNKFHYDNTLTLLLNDDQLKKLKPGQLLSFQNPINSGDNNLNGLTDLNQYGSLSVTGTAINTGNNSIINITYANPDGSGELGVDYFLPQEQGDMYAKFATDIEYFMVITAMTYNTFSGMCNPNETEVTLNRRYLGNSNKFEILKTDYGCWDYQASSAFTVNSLGAISDGKKQGVVICVRGVDPNSTKQKNKYDLSWLFGYNSDEEWGKRSQLIIEDYYYLNHPIKGNINSISHSISSNLDPDIDLNEASGTLYHDSFRFKPAFSGNASFSSYTTNLPMYYSSFDKLTPSGGNNIYKPDNLISTPPFSEAIQDYNGETNCLPNQSNYFVREFKRQIELDLSIAAPGESGACWPCADFNPTWIVASSGSSWNYDLWGSCVKPSPSNMNINAPYNYAVRPYRTTGATYGTITAVANGYWANIGFGIGNTYIRDSLYSHKSYSLVAYSLDNTPYTPSASTVARITIRNESTSFVNSKLLYYDRPPNINIVISKIKILTFKWDEVAIVKLDSYSAPSLNKLNISFWNSNFDVSLPNTLTPSVNFLGESLIDVGYLNNGGNSSFIDFDIEVDYLSSGIILMFPVPSYSDMSVGGTPLTQGVPVLMFINRAQRYVTGQLSPDTFPNLSVFLPISTFPVDITKITIYNESDLIRSFGVGFSDIVNLYACGYRKTSDSTLYFSVFDYNGNLVKTFGPTSADNVGTYFNGSEILTTDTVTSFSLDFNPLSKELIVCWINSDGKIYYKTFNVSIDAFDSGSGIIFMPNITLKTVNQIEVTFDSGTNGTPSDVILKVNRPTKEMAISWQTPLKGVFTMKFFTSSKTEFPSPVLLPNQNHTQTGTTIFDMGTNYGIPSSFNVIYKENTASGVPIKDAYSVFINREPLNRGYYSNEFLEGGGVMLLKNKYNTGNNGYQNQTEYLNGVGKWVYDGYYYSPTYNKDNVIEIKITEDTCKLIMRSDRLPTSTTENKVDSSYGGNSSFTLHTNQYFTAYLLDENGLSFSLGGAPRIPIGFASGQDDAGENFATSALATTTCDGLVPLDCYTTGNNTIGVLPPNNACFYNGVGTEVTDKIMKGGCYVLITQVWKTLTKDLELLYEWRNRINVNYAACRNVFGHVFRNNWINGTLFAFPIKNDRVFTPIFTKKIVNASIIFEKVTPTNPYLTKYGVFFSANFPYSRYCKDTVRLHSKTNEFYYRSSPFLKGDTNEDGAFIGINNQSPGGGRNDKFIKFPTTIMDLGPRSKYLQEIVMSDDLDGYNITNLNKTSFSDVEPLLNLFILSRTVTKSFSFLITGFFSRSLYIDGDYAQMVATNSQVGVSPFDEANYGNNTGFTSQPIFYSNIGPTFGVFYESDLEIRDLVSPRRTLINGDVPNSFCAFNELSNFSQKIPMYQWEIKEMLDASPTPFIFGNETNDWYTGLVTTTTGDTETFFSYKYQSLDRLETQSRFFKTNIETKTNFFKGYIYGVAVGPGTGVTINSAINYNGQNVWLKNNSTSPSNNNNLVTFGTPFYFYFGLKKGKTAIDLFNKKWVNSENVFI